MNIDSKIKQSNTDLKRCGMKHEKMYCIYVKIMIPGGEEHCSVSVEDAKDTAKMWFTSSVERV